MAKYRKHHVKTFFRRLKFAWTNARRSKKQFKENGYVLLPNGSIFVHPKHHISEYGYAVVSASSLDNYGDSDNSWIDYGDDFEDEEEEF